MKRHLITFLIIIIFGGVIVNLSRSIYTLWNRYNLVHMREDDLVMAKDTNQALLRKLAEIENPLYIEKQAREKLNMTKEGEQVILLPGEELQVAEEISQLPAIPYWNQWWELFF